MVLPGITYLKSVIIDKITAPLVQKHQEELACLKSEIAAKDVTISDLKQKLAHHEDRDKSFASRWQQLTDRERKVEERERLAEGSADRLVAERECELECREHDLEVIIDRRVSEDITGKQKGIDENWKYLFRKEHKLIEYEHKILKRAQLIADHLGVPLRRILSPREKKLVDRPANELAEEPSVLTEEHYALIDLVMSCPDDQLKDLLASMQQFQRNLPR